jgi:hypothetical protein
LLFFYFQIYPWEVYVGWGNKYMWWKKNFSYLWTKANKSSEYIFRTFSSLNSAKISTNTFRNSYSRLKKVRKIDPEFFKQGQNRNIGRKKIPEGKRKFRGKEWPKILKMYDGLDFFVYLQCIFFIWAWVMQFVKRISFRILQYFSCSLWIF